MTYPTSLDSFPTVQATDEMDDTGVEGDVLANKWSVAILALQTKVGIDASAVTSSHDYKLSSVTSTAKAVPDTRQVIAGTGLTGGGTLAADRTLAVSYGTTAGTACQGNDSRLSDPRTPTAHKTSHETGGSDALTGSLDANARSAVSKAGTLIGTRRGINLIEGSNVTLTVADNSGSERVDVTIAASVTGGGAISDGDYGDITVSGTGTVMTIDAGAVTRAKMANLTTQRVIGRNSAGSGAPEEVTASALLNWLGTTTGAIIYRDSTSWGILPPGTAGTLLTSGGPGANPTWSAAPAATAVVVGGSTDLSFGAVNDGEVFYRSGTNVLGKAVGSASGTLCAGNDSRLSDSRAPSGSAGGDLTGTYPNPTVASNKITAGKMSASATDVLFGRSTAGAGAGEEIACTAAGRALLDDANAAAQRTTLDAAKTNLVGSPCELLVAVSDETTVITAGTNKLRFRMPFAMTVTEVRGSLNATGTGMTVDINEEGTSILSTKLTFDSGEKTTTTAATPAVISDASLADDAEISVDVDAATGNGAGLKILLKGTRA